MIKIRNPCIFMRLARSFISNVLDANLNINANRWNRRIHEDIDPYIRINIRDEKNERN